MFIIIHIITIVIIIIIIIIMIIIYIYMYKYMYIYVYIYNSCVSISLWWGMKSSTQIDQKGPPDSARFQAESWPNHLVRNHAESLLLNPSNFEGKNLGPGLRQGFFSRGFFFPLNAASTPSMFAAKVWCFKRCGCNASITVWSSCNLQLEWQQ